MMERQKREMLEDEMDHADDGETDEQLGWSSAGDVDSQDEVREGFGPRFDESLGHTDEEGGLLVADAPETELASAADTGDDDVEEAAGDGDSTVEHEIEPVFDGGTEARCGGDGDIPARSIIEAILFATETPLSSGKIAEISGVADGREVRRNINDLNEQYAAAGASFRIEEIAGGFQMLTLPAYNGWLQKLVRVRRENKLTQAALETLAVVAYKQPALRAEVEVIRGVASGDMLNRLREMGLIKIVGRAEEPGRPMLYGTTKQFLHVFGLGSLKDLPKVEELKAPETPRGGAYKSLVSDKAPPPDRIDGESSSPISGEPAAASNQAPAPPGSVAETNAGRDETPAAIGEEPGDPDHQPAR